MDKPTQHHEQQHQNQPPLKCPRCDSTNTKFCYYNNYSLSQPRHFCKACKRYWTSGGTLRNIPVGGGCRKNKRVKRPSASSTTVSAATTASEMPQPVVARSSNIAMSTTRSMAHVNPLFFDMGGISYPRLHSTIDLPPHLPSALGLGFSSSGLMPSDHGCGDTNYIQDLISSAPVLSNGYSSDEIRCVNAGMIAPILGSMAPTTSMANTVPTMASLLASTIQQQKLFSADLKDIQASDDFKSFSSFQDSRDAGDTENELAVKEVKAEGMNMPGRSFGFQNQMELSNPTPYYWNMSSNISTWHDPTNTGSSVPSLI
ncbi:hypothetical protein CDL15_Pgr000158 [Punica granatum]|nr:hypothetical protein CDL15_Pgr000158 [Punica granatum]